MKTKKVKKIFLINIVVFFILIFSLESISFFGRSILGKSSIGFIYNNKDLSDYGNPNQEFISHPFYGHTHTNNKKIQIRGGYVKGPFVFYDNYDENLPTILTLGGSTTDGVFQLFSNGYTWPYQLNETFKKQNIKYNIVNGGVGGYNSEKEFLKLLIDGRKLKNLKIVISLNGINDMENYNKLPEEISKSMPFFSDKNFNIFYNEKYTDHRNYWYYNFLPNTQSFFRYFSNKAKNKIDFQNDFLKSVYLPSFNKYDSDDNWKFSITMSEMLSKKLEVKYYSFLQPTMGLNDCQIPEDHDSNDYRVYKNEMYELYSNRINELYRSLRSGCSELSFCFDLSCAAPPSGNNYSDIRHHNENGNMIISNNIFEIIKTNL